MTTEPLSASAADTSVGERAVFSFSGYAEWRWNPEGATATHKEEYDTFRRLRDGREVIESEIAHDLSTQTRGRFEVTIEFRKGSIVWTGAVEVLIPWLANVGGAIALVQLIAAAVNHIIYTHASAPNLVPHTHVTMVAQHQPAIPVQNALSGVSTPSPNGAMPLSARDRALLLALLTVEVASLVTLLWMASH